MIFFSVALSQFAFFRHDILPFAVSTLLSLSVILYRLCFHIWLSVRMKSIEPKASGVNMKPVLAQ